MFKYADRKYENTDANIQEKEKWWNALNHVCIFSSQYFDGFTVIKRHLSSSYLSIKLSFVNRELQNHIKRPSFFKEKSFHQHLMRIIDLCYLIEIKIQISLLFSNSYHYKQIINLRSYYTRYYFWYVNENAILSKFLFDHLTKNTSSWLTKSSISNSKPQNHHPHVSHP